MRCRRTALGTPAARRKRTSPDTCRCRAKLCLGTRTAGPSPPPAARCSTSRTHGFSPSPAIPKMYPGESARGRAARPSRRSARPTDPQAPLAATSFPILFGERAHAHPPARSPGHCLLLPAPEVQPSAVFLTAPQCPMMRAPDLRSFGDPLQLTTDRTNPMPVSQLSATPR